jgi:UDP-MurNAc hydroxylase
MVVETQQATIVCDPWFVPAFFASWFVFPRNDQLSPELMAKIEHPDYLYISHQHGDHLDEAWLANHIDKSTPVLLPAFATRELERSLSLLGFTNFIRTTNGEEMELRDGLKIAIHVESAIADGPGGDSALVISDGTTRLVNQNDCRTSDLDGVRRAARRVVASCTSKSREPICASIEVRGGDWSPRRCAVGWAAMLFGQRLVW